MASSLVTFIVLVAFAAILGSFLTDRVRSDFATQTADAAETLAESASVTVTAAGYVVQGVDVNDYAASQRAKVRIVDLSGGLIASSVGAPDFGILPIGESERRGYLIETKAAPTIPVGNVLVQYARPMTDLDRTIGKIWIALAVGVAAGTALALAAALAVARRTLRPLNDLTAAAREVRRTADPGVEIPVSPANDEVRDLAVTLSGALAELDEAQARTESALERQREFVADASHELRTPLTALIANLELLSSDSEGSAREDAEAALRSGRRMRDLVTDLLLLARSDSERTERQRVEFRGLLETVREEVEPLLSHRSLDLDCSDAVVVGDPDSLLRAVRNLVANAINHTPDGTAIRVACSTRRGEATIVVEDSGPGIPEDQRGRVFERFYRQGGDAGHGTGLGLAIVAAVVEDHSGRVEIGTSDLGGARFELSFPAAQDSTTTATTNGRRPS